MASRSIKLQTLSFTLGFIIIVEGAAWLAVRYLNTQPLSLSALVRIIQIVGSLIGIYVIHRDLTVIGLSLSTWRRGLINGILWACGFGTFVVLSMGVVYLVGHNPITLVRTSLPSDRYQLVLFFMVGGLISPIAEEICFRGVLFSYFRYWGFIPAMLISSIIFTSLHSFQGFPAIQLVGGVLFAVSFELSKNLLVPIVIHLLGNLAIFTLSLPYFYGQLY